MLRLDVLGGFSLSRAGEPPVALPRKVRALVAYLGLAESRPQAREKLAALLWEDSPEDQARASLRQALAVLRRAFAAYDDKAGWLIAEADTVAMDGTRVVIDAAQFSKLANGTLAQQAEAAALYRGNLLDGLQLSETGFAAWLAGERAQLRDRAVQLFASVAQIALSERRADAALALVGRLLTIDPLHEPGCRIAMRAYAQAGRHADALRQYRGLQAALRLELGVSPEAETVALHHELVNLRRRGPGAAQAIPELAASETPPPATDEAAHAAAAVPLQLRRVAVLSAGVAGYTALSLSIDVERMHGILESYHAAVAEEVAGVGGEVVVRTGDTALAVFGRDYACDDDPPRAAAAALAIHRRLEGIARASGLHLNARVGLAVGAALVAGPPLEPSVLGKPVTMANTLRDEAAPGETLLLESFLSELGGRFSVEAPRDGTGGIRVALRHEVARCDTRPLIGRAAERGQLRALLSTAATGSGLAVCLRGEPGIGKSRLADAVALDAAAAGWQVHCAQIADFGSFALLTPRRQLLLGLLGLVPDGVIPTDLARHPLMQRLDPRHLPWIYQLTGAALPSEIARQLEGRDDAAAARRTAAFHALIEAAAADAPLLLTIEDVHWASPGALRQIAELTQLVARLPVLLLLTRRSEPDLLDLAWRASAGPLMTIDLKPLALAEGRDVARACGAVDDAEATVLAERAGGNPLFLAQLVAAVRDGATARTALPGSVHSLALGRMDRLQLDERRALRAAAVLGRTSKAAAIAAIAKVASYTPSPAATGTLVTADNGRISFVHALIRDAVYSSLLAFERHDLHRAAAAWYRDRDPLLVAAHLEGAEDPGAAEAFADAAAVALRRHRADKALDAVARGLNVASAPVDRHRLGLIKAAALTRTLALDAAADAACAAAAEAVDDAGRAQALLLQATALSSAQQSAVALAVLDAAQVAAVAAGDAEVMTRIYALRGNIHFPLGELDKCLEAHRRALDWSKRAHTTLAEAGALVGLAWAHYQRGDFAQADRMASDCLTITDRDQFDRIKLSALRVRSVSRIFLLAHDDALGDATHAIDLAMEQRDAVNELLARTTAGNVHLERWDQTAAIAVAEPALALGQRIGNAGLEAAPLWVLGTAHGARGDTAEATRLLETARAHGMRGTAIRFAVPRILGTLAFFVDRLRREALAAEGEAMLGDGGVAHSSFGFYGSLVHAGLANGEWDLADRCAAGLQRYAGPDPVPWAAAILSMTGLFGAMGRGTASAHELRSAKVLHARARATPALAWLRPAMKAVERRAGSDE